MNQEIENKLNEVRNLIKQCEEIADRENVEFNILVGKYYVPEKLREVEDGDWYGQEDNFDGNWWMPSRFC